MFKNLLSEAPKQDGLGIQERQWDTQSQSDFGSRSEAEFRDQRAALLERLKLISKPKNEY